MSGRVARFALAATLLGGPAFGWQVTLDGGAGDDGALAVAADGAGNVAAAGFIAAAGRGKDLAVVRLGAADGALLWPPATIDGDAHLDEQANAVAADAAGNVIAAGVLANVASGKDFVVVKLAAADGHELWRYVLAGTEASGADQATAVAVDPNGDVLGAGYTVQTGSGLDLTVVKLAGASGMPVWPQPVLIDGGAMSGDAANALALDAAGNAVVAGFTSAGQGIDFTVLKFAAADGHELWRRTFDGTSHDADGANAVAVNAAGDVAAAGFTTNGGNTDFTVVRLAGTDGSPLWAGPVRIDGDAPESEDEARSVAIDARGNVVAAGVVDNTGSDPEMGFDFTVVALRAADGGEAWRRRVKGMGASSLADAAFAVALDPAGNPAAAGRLENADGNRDLTLVRLSRTNGAELWRQTAAGSAAASADEARAIVVDAAGNVAAAGRIDNAGSAKDFAVVKVGCTGGAPAACGDPATCYDSAVCDPASVNCATAADGTPCDDGDGCTAGDACHAGACTPDDVSALGCTLAGALAQPACAGDRLPRAVKRGFKRARILVERAAGQPAQAKALFVRAGRKLGRVEVAVGRAAARRKRPLSAGCVAALQAIVAESRARLDRLSQ